MEWILLVIVIAVVGFVIMTYNALIAMIEAIKNSEKQIDIQLDRRYKVFEEMIDAVKKIMDYEKTTLKEVVALRNNSQAAKASGDKAAYHEAEDKISQIASGLNITFEQYPDLKAGQNMLAMQEEISNTENKLAYAKQAFNDSIERYEAKKKSFLEQFVVGMFRSKLDQTFVYWQLNEQDRQSKEEYIAKFD